MRLIKYSVKIVHISGKNNAGEDALSRYPAETNVESILELETEKCVEQHTKNYEDVRRWSYLVKSQEEDRIIKLLKEKIETKWKRKDSSRELDRYYQNRQYLSLIQECVMFQNRIIIPEIEKQRVLKEIHNAHQGLTRCIARAKESVWWFGSTEDIKAHVGLTRCIARAKESVWWFGSTEDIKAHVGLTRCIARAKESVWWFGSTEDIKAHVGLTRCIARAKESVCVWKHRGY